MRKVIVNTTPLIALCHIGQLDVLKKMYDEITIPRAVYKELSEKKESICKIFTITSDRYAWRFDKGKETGIYP